MREIRSACENGVPLLALLEPDPTKGFTTFEVECELERAQEHYSKWGFLDGPGAASLAAALFDNEPIEWNRIGEHIRKLWRP